MSTDSGSYNKRVLTLSNALVNNKMPFGRAKVPKTTSNVRYPACNLELIAYMIVVKPFMAVDTSANANFSMNIKHHLNLSYSVKYTDIVLSAMTS